MTAMSSNVKKRRVKRTTGGKTKKDTMLALLRRKKGVSLDELTGATGWQAHSVRGFLSGTLRKKLGLNLVTDKNAGGVQRYFVRNAK